MAEWEDPELMSSHRQTNTTTAYRTTHSEKYLKTSITALPKLRKILKTTSRWREVAEV